MEVKTVVEDAADLEKAPPVADKVIDMAQQFGRMEAEYRQTAGELAELKMSQTRTAEAINELMNELKSMRSAQISTEIKTEQISESVETLAQAETAESSETIEITPPMETHVEIDQKPIQQNRSLIQKLIYGNR